VKAAPKNKGEYYLTDAFQHMIEHGRKIQTAEVGGWYDCGEVGTLLESNGILLSKGRARSPGPRPGVTVIDPVYVEEGVTLERCTIGPNVSIESGARVIGGSLKNAIVGRDAVLTDCAIDGAILGDRVKATGVVGKASLGADSEVVIP
jgi:glucose-1-phosphate thymidylyltransferase